MDLLLGRNQLPGYATGFSQLEDSAADPWAGHEQGSLRILLQMAAAGISAFSGRCYNISSPKDLWGLSEEG